MRSPTNGDFRKDSMDVDADAEFSQYIDEAQCASPAKAADPGERSDGW